MSRRVVVDRSALLNQPLLATVLLVATTMFVLAACSGSTTGSGSPDGSVAAGDAGQPDGSTPADAGGSMNESGSDGGTSATYPAPFPTPPQVVNQGGPVLASPKIVAVFFSNDDMTQVTSLKPFFAGIGTSQYWGALTEYGVGSATATSVVLQEAAPATIDDSTSGSALNKWLENEISMGLLPMPDANTVYSLNFPASTTITSGGNSCTDFGGYHAAAQLQDGTLVAYAVVPRCNGQNEGFDDDIQAFTSSAAHELVESATDPYPDDSPAWLQVDDADFFWDYANGGSELGDMCQDDPEAYYQFNDFPFVVQRFWSNAAVKAGHDPCVPVMDSEVFFNAVPEVKDQLRYTDDGSTYVNVVGVHIPVGQSATIPIDLYSDASTGGVFTVQADDYNHFSQQGNTLLTTSLSKSAGQNGDQLQLTITVNAAGQYNNELFVIWSSTGTGANEIDHFWYGVVGN